MATTNRLISKNLDLTTDIKASLKQATSVFTNLGLKFNRTIVELDINKLAPTSYHQRVLIDSRLKCLKDSLEDYGFLGAIFISARNSNIIDGFYRKEIWAALGNETIPCFKVDCTEEQEKLLYLKLNMQVATFDFTDFGLTFPGLNLVEDYGFTAADLRTTNPSSSLPAKPVKTPIHNTLMRFNTLLQTEQYQRLKAFKEQHALENWADVIDMLLESYETR